jgi:hypothetical protein
MSSKVLDNLRYLGLVLSKLGQDFAMLLVIWPVLQLTFLRAVTYSFAPRTKLRSFCRGGPVPATTRTNTLAHYKNGVVSFEVSGRCCGLKPPPMVIDFDSAALYSGGILR